MKMPAPSTLRQPCRDEVALQKEFLGHGIIEVDEELGLSCQLGAPFVAVELHAGIEVRFGEALQTIGVEVFVVRQPADLGFVADSMTLAAVEHPLDYAHILAEARPEELVVLVFAEPVDVKESWQVFDMSAHVEPVTEVFTHVVTAEG